MLWSEVDAGIFLHGQQNLLKAFGEEGGEIMKLLSDEPAFARALALRAHEQREAYELRFKVQSDEAWARAGSILGDNFTSPSQCETVWGFRYNRRGLKKLVDSMPSEKVLGVLKERGFRLIAGPPMNLSILEMHAMNPSLFQVHGPLSSFGFTATQIARSGWLVISDRVVEDSIGKDWREQLGMPGQFEKIANAAEAMWAMGSVVIFSEKINAATSSFDTDSSQICVCYWPGRKLYFVRNPLGSSHKPGVLLVRHLR